MALRNSHPNRGGYAPAGQSSRRRNAWPKGWIDIEKIKAVIPLAAFLLTSLLIFGAVSFAKISPAAPGSASRSIRSFLGPYIGTAGTSGQRLKLSREYLYAQGEIIAVEDAGATPAPSADLAIWRPSTGTWMTKEGRESRRVTVRWGVATDIPAIGDYDGDGKTDFCVFRPSAGRWYLLKSGTNGSSSTVAFGSSGDKPAPADFDGDGKTDIAVWRPSTGFWYVRRSSDGNTTARRLGLSGDVPSPKDYDGDGIADIAVWRPSTTTFYSRNSSDGRLVRTNMRSAGSPVTGDYDGDGRDDFAVRNGSRWIIRKSVENRTTAIAWQSASDVAVPNDYDGDGAVDIASWRPSNGYWYIRQSSNGRTRTERWGARGDIPVPALYRR